MYPASLLRAQGLSALMGKNRLFGSPTFDLLVKKSQICQVGSLLQSYFSSLRLSHLINSLSSSPSPAVIVSRAKLEVFNRAGISNYFLFTGQPSQP